MNRIWIESRAPRLKEEWNSGERCAALPS